MNGSSFTLDAQRARRRRRPDPEPWWDPVQPDPMRVAVEIMASGLTALGAPEDVQITAASSTTATTTTDQAAVTISATSSVFVVVDDGDLANGRYRR